MHIKIPKLLKQTYSTVALYPKKYTIGGSLLVAALLLVIIGAWPRTIHFSYGGASCVAQPVLLPQLLQTKSGDAFTLRTENMISIGSFPLVARKVCATAIKTPKPGTYHSQLSLLGTFVGTKYTVQVGTAPTANFKALAKPLPVAKPLIGSLSEEDRVFVYKLEVEGKKAACTTKERVITCDVPSLKLEQGKTYKTTLARYFNQKHVATVASENVQTLTAVAVTETSIKKEATVYDKPRAIMIKFDKPVDRVEATLSRTDGSKESVPITVDVAADGVTVRWDKDLERVANYELSFGRVVARDGSSLAERFSLPFVVSGGPKVSTISIPKTGVKPGTVATITFDQALSETQDITQFVQLGGGAVFAGKQGNQVLVSLVGVARCGDFSIKLSEGIASPYDISGHSAWGFNGRMLCQTTSVIGQSSRGRPITAYQFGTGSSTVIYTGGIHGNELSTRSLMMRWIDELEANARAIPVDKMVIVVPAINPDGIASTSRTNGNNVDLNRNFGTNDWQTDITTVSNAPFPGGGGSSPMSEPETKAIAGLVSRTSARLVLSYHSIGGLIAANQTGISAQYAQTYARLSGYGNATGSGTTFEYAISGTADDYYGQRLGVPSILVELGSHSYHQFERNQQAMWAMLR